MDCGNKVDWLDVADSVVFIFIFNHLQKRVAERVRFELTEVLQLHTLSKRAP